MGNTARTSTPRLAELAVCQRLLVVDPNENTRRVFREVLRAIAPVVDEAADGREALVQALGGRPGIVIIGDMRLPFIDGFALCALLRRDPTTRRSRILMITDDDAAQMSGARSAGADAVLVEPCPPESLVTAIWRLPVQQLEVAALPRARVRTFERFTTTTPPMTPPRLRCPSCGGTLRYEKSYIGGLSARSPEQWDYYACAKACGAFQYRQRTRKIRWLGG
jgi:CheY-like chemotaxis protein